VRRLNSLWAQGLQQFGNLPCVEEWNSDIGRPAAAG